MFDWSTRPLLFLDCRAELPTRGDTSVIGLDAARTLVTVDAPQRISKRIGAGSRSELLCKGRMRMAQDHPHEGARLQRRGDQYRHALAACPFWCKSRDLKRHDHAAFLLYLAQCGAECIRPHIFMALTGCSTASSSADIRIGSATA